MNNNFEKYLKNLGISSKSLKNYKSDASHFFTWAKESLKNLGVSVEELIETSPFLSHDFIESYLSFLKLKNVPVKTINRRLSTLRHLSRFFKSEAIVESDFMVSISNIGPVKSNSKQTLINHPSITQFQAHLEANKIAKNTVKNYVSDVRQFLNWLEKNHAHTT